MQHHLQTARVIVCVGSGGVGKTTVSAAIAIAAAMEGQKVLVMTIDPARRLADALGLNELGDEEFEVPAETWQKAGLTPKGQLFGMMLNQKLTFDQLVDRFSPTQESARTIKENHWYQQMSAALAGAQDYMAVEKLYEMVEDRDYDLIVLDTPPTSNALDFLEAPERIKGILGIRSVQWVQEKLRSEGGTGRLLRWGGNTLLKALGRVTGRAVISEITKLLDDLSVLYDSFQEHADAAWTLLRSDTCHFIQVSTPRRLALAEALFMHEHLREANMGVKGFVLNRVPGWVKHQGEWHSLLEEPPSKSQEEALATELLASLPQEVSSSQEDISHLLSVLRGYWQEEHLRAELAREEVVFLKEHVVGEPFVVLLPAIPEEIGDLEGVARISQMLIEGGVSFGTSSQESAHISR